MRVIIVGEAVLQKREKVCLMEGGRDADWLRVMTAARMNAVAMAAISSASITTHRILAPLLPSVLFRTPITKKDVNASSAVTDPPAKTVTNPSRGSSKLSGSVA
jgi:hypothetical protein